MMVSPATTQQERPVWFESGDESLFGIHTTAMGPSRGIGVIIAAGGGTPLATSVNDVSVRLCRSLSAHGFDGFRFDYHGSGESTGFHDRFHLEEPFVEDLAGAVDCMANSGVEGLVLVGSCFGARTALASASGLDGVREVVLLAPPVRDFEMGERTATRMAAHATWAEYLRRAARLQTLRNLKKGYMRRSYARVAKEKLRHMVRSRNADPASHQARYLISPRFLEPLRTLIDRGVQTTIVFGADDELYQDFQRAQVGKLGKLLARADGLAEVVVVPGKIHGFTSVAAQDRVVEVVVDQLNRRHPSG